MRGHEALIDQFKELKVRSRVVKEMANIYVENHMTELESLTSVLKLLAARQHSHETVRERFQRHINLRVDQEYPAAQHDTEAGAVPSRIREALSRQLREDAQAGASRKSDAETAFSQKQAVGEDRCPGGAQVLENGVEHAHLFDMC